MVNWCVATLTTQCNGLEQSNQETVGLIRITTTIMMNYSEHSSNERIGCVLTFSMTESSLLTILNMLGNSHQKCGRFRRNAGHMSGSDNTDRRCCSNDMRIRGSSKCGWLRRMNRRCVCTCQPKTSSTSVGSSRHSLRTCVRRT